MNISLIFKTIFQETTVMAELQANRAPWGPGD